MTAPRAPRLGSVVWASIEDPNGFRKVRPAVVISPAADIADGKPVRLAAITTRLPDPLPDDHVLLPWNPQGTARSGLRRKCAAVARWLVEASVDDVQVVGIVPAAVIDELLAKVAAARSPPGPT